jgi:hypothetical protein
MKGRANLLVLGGFLLALLAFFSYFLFFARFPATRDVPWANLLLFAAAGCLVTLGLRRAFGQPQLDPFDSALHQAVQGFAPLDSPWRARGKQGRPGRPKRYGGKVSATVLGGLSLLIFAVFLTYNFYVSAQLPPANAAPRAGQKAPEFTLPDSSGRRVKLAELLAPTPMGSEGQVKPWVLLIFYRGYW